MDSRATWPRASSPRVREVRSAANRASLARLAPAFATALSALAACDGTLQFSATGETGGIVGGAGAAGTAGGGAGGRANDASAVTDAPGEVLSDVALSDRGTGFAPPCYKDADCPVNKLHCDIATSTCVECVASVDCKVTPYLVCETGAHRCFECLSSADCGPNSLCHPDTRICLARCGDGGACPAAQPYCDTRGLCLECRTNADCFRPDLCDPAIGRCAFCADDRSCTAPNVLCDPYNPGRARCKECLA